MMRVLRPNKTELKSSYPLATAHLTRGRDTLHRELVEWTSVKQVTYKRTGEKIVRHTLSPITTSHTGIFGVGPLPGIGLLEKHDVGRTLVVDVSLDENHEIDVKVTD
jgi:hypothetical protein